MGKIGKLRKKFTAFVNQLSPDQVREQLVLAYLQMEQSQRVLQGEDVEPLTMLDNGECSDLELFYRCKKVADELAYLNKMVHEGKKVGAIELEVKVDTNPAILSLKELRKEFSKMADSMKPKFLQVGSVVYFLSKGRIHKSTIKDVLGLYPVTGEFCFRVNGYDIVFFASSIYDSAVRLASTIGKLVNNHVSVSSDHESAYFIDQKSRVFKAAKWYLEEQKIEHFECLSALREYLLNNIVDDTKKE